MPETIFKDKFMCFKTTGAVISPLIPAPLSLNYHG